ncbi:DUF6683 family protein [Cellvibrio sp.]|uniref:DUF6683 family protein n=1 Tax=Cellvibrio sp. TaxID=1965322 RepID=UPI00396476A7
MDFTTKDFLQLLKVSASVALLSTASISSHAQWLGQDYATYGVPQVNYAANSFLNFSVLNNASEEAAAETSTIAPRTGKSTVAADLAARYTGADRAQLTKVFTDSLANFEQVTNRLGLPNDDVASALAAFLVGNYIAMHGTSLPPDEEFVALTAHLRTALASSPQFVESTPAQKRQAYEQLAMMGMFMTTARLALAQTPNPKAETHFRNHAKANLEQLLNRPADTLEIKGGQVSLH